jgi:hypothetical protein
VYEKYDSGMVYLSDDSPLNIVGSGRVLIRFHDGIVKRITQVLHISSLAWNVLLVNELNDASVQVVFSYKGCKMVQVVMVLPNGCSCGHFVPA